MGRPPKIFGVLCPQQLMFYCISINTFSKIFKFWSFIPLNFFRKISKISQQISEIFSTFTKSKKKLLFLYPNWSKITILIKIKPNFYLKLQKIANFPSKTSIFQNFRRLRCRKFGVLSHQKSRFFWSWGPPLGPGSPPK